MLMSHCLVALALCLAFHAKAGVSITDSLGRHQLDRVPTRVAALNWDLAENLMELGVIPVGVPNIKDYHTWVVSPALPSSVVDLGTRTEPNLARLASLKPDLILVATPQRDLIPRLRQIAPVLYYETYQAERSAAEAAIENFRYLAQALGKSTEAERKLASMAGRFAELKLQLAKAYGAPPQVTPIRFASTTAVYLYGQRSTTQYALEQLGLTDPMPVSAGRWGIVQKRLLDLQHAGDGHVVYFRPFHQEEKLKQARLWQAMPFVRAGQVNAVEAVWNYGGAMSILRIGEGMATSLLEIAP